jgi:RND family efflux transporter MFP subunit
MLAGLLLPASLAAEEADETLARGPTRPHRLATLGPGQEGVVAEVAFAEGAQVRAGEVLVRLRDDVQAARVGLARAAAEAEGELRQALIQREEALAVFERTRQAAGRGAANEWELRQARARYEVARAAADAAEERRRVEQRRLELERAAQEQFLIRAPFDGVVTRVDTVAGATLTRTDRPITVADLAQLEAVLFLPARAWPLLRLGADYTLTLAAPFARPVTARLRHADPVMDAASSRFRAVFMIANADGALPAGVEAALDLRALAP